MAVKKPSPPEPPARPAPADGSTVFPYDDEVRSPYDDEVKNPHEETGDKAAEDTEQETPARAARTRKVTRTTSKAAGTRKRATNPRTET
ncbi:MAG TPA: hypothetical protein VJS45_01780 [Acidimicrobiia bacterium]|nr:hypothetical protein [Acidimicrobiia bacterium]